MVTRADLEAQLSRLSVAVEGPAAGFFGPQSLTWRVDREAALFLGAGRALLLQLAHPWVAQAIHDHSTTLADPVGRFHRTFGIMFALVFGDRDSALAAARRLHVRHSAITGTMEMAAGAFPEGSAYRANDASALMWVHATLLDTALLAYDLVLPPLTPEAREGYYSESRRLAALFGIPAAIVPPDWLSFERYRDDMIGHTLAVSGQAREIAQILLVRGARRALRPPFWYRALTASLLPGSLRDAFGLRIGDRDERTIARVRSRLAAVYPRLPERIRFVGPYFEARERLGGRDRPTLLTRAANRAWIGRARL